MRGEYSALIVFAALGMGIMASSRDLMTLYVGLELNSLASYVLASFMRGDDRSSEAGLKYFVLGALASGILLFGISLLYGFSGTTDFAGVAAAMTGEVDIGLLRSEEHTSELQSLMRISSAVFCLKNTTQHH